ncbi:MAG: hypothetical protein KDA45_13995, partial [Planctomycetales bacterium]|nr:hypothetical protein [Planctomycetales bacterium]
AFLASRFRPTVREHLLPVAKRVSFLLLIALNYLNGAACLPELAQRPLLLLWPMLGAGSMLSLTYACYFAFQRCSLLRGTEAE